jgi:choline dehydrogenase-like flavoprotein
MASRYGTPAGSSLADWPITYDDLESFYEKVEWAMGVSGDSDLMGVHWPRKRSLPMPAVPTNAQGLALRRAASQLGWPVFKVPLLINSVPFGGRGTCNGCNQCVGFHCEVDAKNGTQNTMLPRAIATGRCDLLAHARVHRIEVDGTGQACGVTFSVNGAMRTENAPRIVLAAGAIETARLLLLSRSAKHPDGLGNQHDVVGRNLQGHYYPGANGFLPEAVMDNQGPGVNTACIKFNHGNPNVVGGGMLADEFIMLPVIFWKRGRPADAPNWGHSAKQLMREQYAHAASIKGPVQEIPSPNSRITLDPAIVDSHGLPVARLSGTTHPETVRTAEFMRQRAIEWMQACGATRWWSEPPELRLSAGQHQAGTCRMGHDPGSSVVDANCRVHGQRGLYIADGSVHVTNGGFNPVLTIMALAWRTAEHVAR